MQLNKKVLASLKKLSSVEKKQAEKHVFINDMPHAAIDSKDKINHGVISLSKDYFFKYHSVYISKHNRFAPYPEHTHKFLELNYMLSGSCEQIVDGNIISLNEGDILMMNVGCNHSIKPLGKDDILINLLFRDESITFNLLNDIHRNNSLTYGFLSDISLGKKPDRNYIIFPENGDIKKTIDSIIEEYYLEKPFSNSIIESYLDILLSKILRHHPLPTVSIHNDQQQLVFKCLNEIDKNYQNITLTDLSKKLGYNKEYLGNLIKKITHSSFSDLKTQQRLIQANNLIQSSTLPINSIIEEVGIKNKNFFYKKYQELYGMSPAEKRKSMINRHTQF